MARREHETGWRQRRRDDLIPDMGGTILLVLTIPLSTAILAATFGRAAPSPKMKGDGGIVYGQSKFACLLFGDELDRRLQKSDKKITALFVHPGGSESGLFADMDTDQLNQQPQPT